MASNEQQWAITSRTKQQIRQNKRRERAQRMLMQAQQKECADSSVGSPGGIHSSSHGLNSSVFPARVPAFSNNSCQESNDDDSEASHHPEDIQQRPVKFQMTKSVSSPSNKPSEPLYEEDVIDGFAIVSFTSYEDLEAAVRIAEKTSCLPDPLVPLDTKERIRPSPSKRSRKSSGRSNGTVKARSSLESSTSQQPSVSNLNGPGSHVHEKLEAAIDSGSRDSRGTSIDRFSDVSRHSNSSRGYLCDSESEENDKNVNHQELRGHSPTTAGSRPVGEFVAPVKQRPFSPAHAGLNPGSSSSLTGENGGSNLRWVGLSGSPRPATAVAPHGHFQNGPRLPDCQPTEGGAGPSPAPPAAPSPRLTPHPPVTGSPLNTFPLTNSVPVIRSEFNPFTAPSTSPSSSSLTSSGPPPLSYIAPPFYSSAGQRPPSTDGKQQLSGGAEAQRRTPTLPSVLSHKFPPPPGPLVKPPSPFHSGAAAAATGSLRPSFSMAAPVSSASASPQSTLVPPAPGPPPVFTSSSYPFFPPVSMMRTSSSSSSHTAASFLAPSPPTSALPPQPRHSSLGPPPLTFSEQPFALTNRIPYSTVATTFPPASTKSTTPSTSDQRPVSSVSELNSSGSRPTSRASSSDTPTRGSLPFPGHLNSRRSPSLPPPPSLATFSSPVSSWPRPPAPDPTRQFCPSPNSTSKTSSSPTVRPTSGGRHSPAKEPLSLVSVKAPSSASIPQMSTDSYSDMLRQELNSRFLNSTPGISSILPPPPAPGANKLLDSSSLYRPMMPPLGHGLPGLGPNPFPAPPLPPHSVAYGLTPSAPQLSVSSSMGQPTSVGAGGLMSNLSALGLPTASSNLSSLPSKSKPGKWNAMHVRIAWEIYQNQQRQARDPHSDPKRALNLTSKPSGATSGLSGLSPSVPPLPPVKLPGGGSFVDPLPSPHNSHNSNPYGFSHHNVAGFLPRMPSISSNQQHPTTPPSHSSLPQPGVVRSSPAPDQWNRLPHSSPAPWLPLMSAGPMSSLKVEPPASSSSSSAAAHHHHHQQQLAQKERDRQRKEEREREKERDRERAREKEREKQEREREKKREEERERRRHASRSPLHHSSRPSTNGSQSSKNELSSSSSSKSSSISSAPSMSSTLPPLPTFHPGMQAMTSAAMVERSRLGLPPLPSAGLYGQPFDPYMRGMDPLTMEREQREFLSRFGASASHLAGLAGPSLYGHGPSPSADRYPYGLGTGLPPDRYRDAAMGSLPPHLSHHMASSLGLSLAGQQGGVSLNDRYGPIPGMSGSALYPPTSTGYPFPPLGPSSMLSSGLGAGMGSLPILPPSMLSSSSATGKRSPPPPSPAPSSSLPGGPLSNPSGLASLGRSHMGMLPPGLGLSSYPMPSPSPMLNSHHLLPPLGSSLVGGGGARSGSSATPPVVGGRPMMDLTSPHQQTPGLAPYNPLDPFPTRKDDPQSR